ncbi:MAG: DsbA family protein [Solirubrobacteraceae bacterium]|nr:DsbA family protein [Solirubrobacteraceae bacterium]
MSAGLVALFVVVVAAVAILVGGGDDGSDAPSERASSTTTTATSETSADAATLPPVVTDDPRLLGAPGSSGVTFTEFLDFECEGCRAAYPAVEELRKAYAGRVTFNIRYFPLPGHQNSRPAAIAVEAASQQGKLEEMYRRMFETQAEWGEKRESQAGTFRGFAEDLGLDMKRYDAAVADPATLRRVESDFAAGSALGVQGTPTFFVNERRIDPRSVDDLRNEIDAAIAGS